MISGSVTREFVPPKCNRGEFEHHARQQASIDHSHRIRTPTRLQGTRKPVARVSPTRLLQPSHTPAHRRQRTLAPSLPIQYSGTKTLEYSLCVWHAPPTYNERPLHKPTPCTGGGRDDRLDGNHNTCNTHVKSQIAPPASLALRECPWLSRNRREVAVLSVVIPPYSCREYERAFLAATCVMLVTGFILLAQAGVVSLYWGRESRRSTRGTSPVR